MISKMLEQELPKPNILMWTGAKNIKHSTKVFSEEEIKIIFDTIRGSKNYWNKKGYKDWGEFNKVRDICLLNFIYYGALRPKEACYLKFVDVDFQDKTIFISGKNNKTRKDRIIHLSKQLMPILQEYLSFPKRFWKNTDYLFPSYQGNPISPQTLKYIIREKALKPAKLYEKNETGTVSRTRLYSLRKSRASHLLNQSKDIFLCANILGHSDIRTTASFYLHKDKEYNNYLNKMMDGESEALKTPDIQINQNNINLNFIFQQINNLMIQQQKQSEVLIKLVENMNKQNA